MAHARWVAVALLLGAAAWAGALPAPPSVDYPLIDELTYPDAAAARRAWHPMGATAGVAPVEAGGRRALRMPCNFKGTTIDRASWDLQVKLDLTACRGIQFDLHCADASPIGHFSLYLHSGDGWYAAGFGPSVPGKWGRVTIDKTDTKMEGRPGGWGTVDIIRVSAWRGKNVDTEFHIANLGLLGADAAIAVIRGESVAKNAPREMQSVATFTKSVGDALDGLGLSYAVISDLDVTAERLKGKQIAILPHNPAMPNSVAEQLVAFLKGGGKLVGFYVLPGQLKSVVGIEGGGHLPQQWRGNFAAIHAQGDALAGLPKITKQLSWNIRETRIVPGRSRVAATWFNDKGESTGEPAIVVSDNCAFLSHVLLGDDAANKRRMLLAMVGHFEPKLWEQVADGAIGRVGRFGPFDGLDALAGAVGAGARGLAQARKLRDEAATLRDRKQFPEAIAQADAAHRSAIEAWCAAQKPRKGEHRAWWCHSAFGPAGMTWDQAAKALADNGFTAIVPNMLWGGTAYYKSSVLPVAPEVAEKGDQIALCAAACRKHGIECHVWKVNWNMSHRAPKDFAERMKREGRTQVMFDGKPQPRWLCPSHPDNQKLEIDAMVEVATKYDVHGIHFDYIRYPGPQGCFCPGCRERFEKLLGRKVANWPRDTRNDDAVRERWLDFRRANITKVVSTVSDIVRKAKPKVKISAAVFRNWPVDRDTVGQDWKVWCDRGWLDFVCPMDYTPNNAQFENQVRQQLEWAGKVPCYPGMGLSVWGSGSGIVKLIEQIQIARRLGAPGFTIFEFRAAEAREVAPLCGLGITRR